MKVGEDRSGFVEQLDVALPDKRTEKHRRRLAETRVQALEAAARIRLTSDVLDDAEEKGTNGDVRALRSELESLRKLAAKKRARADELERELTELEARVRHAVTFRLHSTDHYLDLTPEEYERLSAAQRRTPTLIGRRDGRQWWWYLDRFWWDDANLGRHDVASDIHESELASGLERHLFEEARDATFRGDDQAPDDGITDDVRRAVWQRDAGRCVECGSTVDLRFDTVPGEADAEGGRAALRCRTCTVLRARHGSQARGW